MPRDVRRAWRDYQEANRQAAASYQARPTDCSDLMDLVRGKIVRARRIDQKVDTWTKVRVRFRVSGETLRAVIRDVETELDAEQADRTAAEA